jgi:hypothetical protein
MLPKDQKLETPPEIFSQGQRNRWSSVESSIWVLKSEAPEEDVARSLARTLFDQPRRIEPRFLYDERGSQLFEKICTLPEYYLTRTENCRFCKEDRPSSAPASRTAGRRNFCSC